MELNTQQHRSLFITQSMRQLYSELAKTDSNLGWTRVLKGASGAGKSTTLLFIGHMAILSGCIVFSLQGHAMLRPVVREWTQVILYNWVEAIGKDVLSAIKCPLAQSMSLYDLVSIGAKDSGQSIYTMRQLLLNLCVIEVVPVVILIDECNAFHDCNSETESEVAGFCDFVSRLGDGNIRRGCILRACSASFSVMPIEKDGDSLFTIQIYPMNSDSFALFVQTLIDSFKLKFSIPSEFFSLCAGLPREAVSIFFLISENQEDNFDVIRAKYFDSRTLFYEHRIGKLTNNDNLIDAVRTESIQFAARLFIGEKMTSAPAIWETAGLVVRKDMHRCLPCEAAERGLIRSFREDTARAAIQIFSSDATIRWRALELAFVFVFRRSIIGGNPVAFECTDLRGETLSTVLCSVDKIMHYSSHLEPSSVVKGTLVVCPRGTAVIDFLLFGKDGVKIFVQVSECAYVNHSTNIEDIPKINAIYQNALVQTAAERREDVMYMYITTSSQALVHSRKFNPKVLVISNAGSDNKATRFFRNLI
jgi:hypothetical protein